MSVAKNNICALVFLLSGCNLANVGRPPEFTNLEGSYQHHAMYSFPMLESEDPAGATDAASLWTGARSSLLGDRRAAVRGDILTVVIEIDDKADISNSSNRGRSNSNNMGANKIFGISKPDLFETESSSKFSGNGSVSRAEELTLRIAATVVEKLPNGVLRIEGQQEVRVNNELRELLVTGYVRPNDISRHNEITYDKVAGARISYGGRGQITDMQQPPIGSQIADIIMPF